jgi:hypothetical protein
MLKQFHKIRSIAIVAFLTAAWFSSLAGFAYLTTYQLQAGKASNAPKHCPTISEFSHGKAPFTLLLFLHPQCPCSTASISELQRLMAHTESNLDVHIIFWQPLENKNLWHDTPLIKSAKAMPQVEVSNDEGGVLAKRFGANTSGTTLVYSRDGSLLFRGGITLLRGHEGDNKGVSAIYDIVNNRTASKDVQSSPVFGCSL